MTVQRRVIFATVAVLFSTAMSLALVLAVDIHLHHSLERSSGLNIWGYRGPTVTAKQAGEHRLVVLGGSTALGYGVTWDDAFPAQLEADLRPLSNDHAPVTVVNLGMNSQGAYSFRFALEDYVKLDYDTVVLYEGYNDLGREPNLTVGRRESPVFRWTGYYPIFPTAFREKAMALRYGGDIDAAYRGNKTVFRPGLAARTTATALEAAAGIGQSLDSQMSAIAESSEGGGGQLHVSDAGCSRTWAHYCGAVYDAIRFSLSHDKRVLVVTQPYLNDRHREQQRELTAMLASHFGGNTSVAHADLGDAIDLASPLSYDHMHLTPAGNAIVARRLVPAITQLMPESFTAVAGR